MVKRLAAGDIITSGGLKALGREVFCKDRVEKEEGGEAKDK